MLDRIPFRRKLLGFYVVHVSILIILLGSLVTKVQGIDGTVELTQEQATDEVRLSEDRVYFGNGSVEAGFVLPETVRETRMDEVVSLGKGTKIRAIRYLPYAEATPNWIYEENAWSSVWTLKNSRVEQQLTLSTAGQTSANLGPLAVELVNPEVFSLLKAGISDQGDGAVRGTRFLLVDTKSGLSKAIPDIQNSYPIPGTRWVLKRTLAAKGSVVFFELSGAAEPLKFFPRYSAKPVTRHMEPDESSPLSLLDVSGFSGRNVLLLSRTSDGRIHYAILTRQGGRDSGVVDRSSLALPWMGLELTLREDHPSQRPEEGWRAGTASKDEAKNTKALLVRVENTSGGAEQLWVTNRQNAASRFGLTQAQIGTTLIKLPFSMQLERFKMDSVPGMANRPASYESFVRLSRPLENGDNTAHIYMNHPLKSGGYTFYQASYLQGEDGKYHSILSVNRDPGRPITYGGSLLLVFGLLIHFLIIYGYISVGSGSPKNV
jgi:hypothetical protein